MYIVAQIDILIVQCFDLFDFLIWFKSRDQNFPHFLYIFEVQHKKNIKMRIFVLVLQKACKTVFICV